MLLQHGFISSNLDAKPIKDLLLEYKAEVVEEVVDDEAEVCYSFYLFLPNGFHFPCCQHSAPVKQPELEIDTNSIFCIFLYYTLPPRPVFSAKKNNQN